MRSLTLIFILSTLLFAQTEQINNGTFDDSLSHWYCWGSGAEITTEESNSFVTISNDSFRWAKMSQILSLPSETSYIKVSGSIKTDSVVSAGESWEQARVSVEFLNPCGDQIKPDLAPAGEALGTTEWQTFEQEYEVQSGSQSVKISGALGNCTGSAHFDNLSVQFYDSSMSVLNQNDISVEPIEEIEVPQAGKQAAQITETGEKYLLYLPENYDSSKVWPLVVYLHGAGERSYCLDKLRNHGTISERIEAGDQFPFIMVAPLCPMNKRWENNMILPVIETVLEDLPIDETRVTLTGLSMGGIGSIRLALDSPEIFAGVLVVAGKYTEREREKSLLAFKDLPLWIIHGTHDAIYSSDSIAQFAHEVKKISDDVTLTIYENEDHVSSFKRAYGSDELYQWLLEQKK